MHRGRGGARTRGRHIPRSLGSFRARDAFALLEPAPLNPPERCFRDHHLTLSIAVAARQACICRANERSPSDVADALGRNEIVGELTRFLVLADVPKSRNGQSSELVTLAHRGRFYQRRL